MGFTAFFGTIYGLHGFTSIKISGIQPENSKIPPKENNKIEW